MSPTRRQAAVLILVLPAWARAAPRLGGLPGLKPAAGLAGPIAPTGASPIGAKPGTPPGEALGGPLAGPAARLGRELSQPNVDPTRPLGVFFEGDGKPGAPGGPAAYDGPPPSEEPQLSAEDFTALAPAEQIARSGWYGRRQTVVAWSAAGRGDGWMKFYRRLYEGLSALGPQSGYASQRDGKPVFFLGGHDVAQIILGVGRSVESREVNLYGRWPKGQTPVSLWTSVALPGPGETAEVDVNPESTGSLWHMMAGRRPGDALESVQNNIFLKWNLVALSAEGVEISPLDEPSGRDIDQRTLRLSLNRGLLSSYEVEYNLILLQRALTETAPRWRVDPRSRELLEKSIRTLPQSELAKILPHVSKILARSESPDVQGTLMFLGFARRELGRKAFLALRRAAWDLPMDEGGLLEEGVPKDLIAQAAPWRPKKQIETLNAKPRAPGESFRIALLGDIEPGRFWIWRKLFNEPGVYPRLMAAIEKRPYDFIIQLGDMVSRGTVKNFRGYLATLETLKPSRPYLAVIGNHDRRRPHGVTDSRLYRSLFGPTDYFFDRGDVRFVVLDSSAGRVTRDQLKWLQLEALATPQRKIVFSHMPPAVLSEWTDVPGRKGAGGFRQGSKEFATIMARFGVELVCVGNIHAYATTMHKGVRYLLSGSGGSPLFPARVRQKFYNFIEIVATPRRIEAIVHPLEGKPFRARWDDRPR